MPDRDEGAALRRVLPLTFDGKVIEVRTLTLNETAKWLRDQGQVVSNLTVEDSEDPGVMLSNAMLAGTDAAVAALVAYDTAGALGGAESLGDIATPQEIQVALEAVYEAALPFDSDAARSVAAAFGGPTRLATTVVSMAMARLVDQPPALSMPLPSPTGGSGTRPSGSNGRRNSSSSGGPTVRTSRTRKHGTSGTSLQTV